MHLHPAYGNNAYPVIPAGQVLPADESARFDMPSWQPLQEPPHCGRPPLHPCPRKKDQSTIPLESKTTVSTCVDRVIEMHFPEFSLYSGSEKCCTPL